MEDADLTIAELVASLPRFSILGAALERTGLTDVLADPAGSLTVFAPGNIGFETLAESFGVVAGGTVEGPLTFSLSSDDVTIPDGLAGTEEGTVRDFAFDIGLVPGLSSGQSVSDPEISIVDYEVAGSLEAGNPSGFDSFFLRSEDINRGTGDLTGAQFYGNGASLQFDIAADADLSDGLQVSELEPLAGLDFPAPVDAEDAVFVLNAREDGTGRYHPPVVILRGDGTGQLLNSNNTGVNGQTGRDIVTDGLDFGNEYVTNFTFDPVALTIIEADAEPAPGGEDEMVLDAIVAALDGLDSTASGEELLEQVLLYHLQEGAFSRDALSAGPDLTSLLGPAPEATATGLVDEDRGFRDPRFVEGATDLSATNGIVHTIDRVALPINLPDATDLFGGPGDDLLDAGPEVLFVDGAAGEDTLRFAEPLGSVAFAAAEGGFTAAVSGEAARVVDIRGIERIELADTALEVSDDPLAAQVFRLFGVGLGREGDIAGVSFWTGEAMERGIGFVADAILLSDEFADRFGGAVPTDADIVEEFYGNFLGREPDPAGLAFWTNEVETGRIDTGELLLAFSESPEFLANTADLTDDGVLIIA